MKRQCLPNMLLLYRHEPGVENDYCEDQRGLATSCKEVGVPPLAGLLEECGCRGHVHVR
jgi:hypothetical protein